MHRHRSVVKPLKEKDLDSFYLEVMLAFYVLLWGAIVCCYLMYNRPTVYCKIAHISNNIILLMFIFVNLKIEFEFDTENYRRMFLGPYILQAFFVIAMFVISFPTILFPKALETEIRMVQRYKFYTLMAKICFVIILYNFFIRIWLASLIYGSFDWDYIDEPQMDWIVMSVWPYGVVVTIGSWFILYYLDWPTVKRFVERLRHFYRLTHRLSRLFNKALKRRGSRAEQQKE